MVYIEKEGLSAELGRKIIEIRKSDMWKSIEKDNPDAVRQVFDNVFPKNDVKAALIHEQRGLCAYCMRRIHMDTHSRVEHFIPLSVDKEKAIDYNNMLGVCDGGEKIVGQQGHISTEILKGRRDAYDRARKMMENLNKSGKCTSGAVRKIMNSLLDKEEMEEFVGVKLYYFRKKYTSLVRRGL